MAKKLTWICDGCGTEKIVRDGRTEDWHTITVTLEGFRGYPVTDHGNWTKEFELCPNCQRYLHEMANPLMWPRESIALVDEAQSKAAGK
ncbi:hypothetical protein NO932_06440 [Pelagibacterium sp. 26DY04]|uniref:hypothetical protein n=1 Tax=Pelagibacterium sp. 26DY04 TaxID=2967130 RepID=UPI00281650E0|nr:hypothetical protein [Pelagibacterium sp. 26DY04]WMT88243.1 hypothetical protein NO932_06440 [Pelagibacterium sp. 26DY04]